MSARKAKLAAVGAIAVAAVAVVTLTEEPGEAQFGRRGFGFGMREEVKLVDQYDTDGDGRLNADERRAARGAVADSSPSFGRRRPVQEPRAGQRLTPADARPYPATPLYHLGTLRTIFLEFDNPEWEQELEDFHNTDVEVPATMIVDGRTYKGVGVGFRGASSFRMVPAGLKRPLNISVDFTVDGQYLRGYRTLNLLNANNDPTFLRAILYTEIARQYIPIPKMNFVRLVINGESWGVYLNAQQFNSDFVRDFYRQDDGERWKAPGSPRGQAGLEYLGDDPDAYRPLYEIKTKDKRESWDALIELTRVLNETPIAELEAALAPILDVDETLRFLALEVALANSDGYWSRASDYSLYRDPSGRFHIVPHDVNEGLGGRYTRLDPLVAVSDPSKPLRSRLLTVPALRERYLAYVREIATKWLDWTALLPIVQPAHALIAADVKIDTRKLYDFPGFQAGVAPTDNPLKSFFDARRAFLLEATGAGQRADARRAPAPSATR